MLKVNYKAIRQAYNSIVDSVIMTQSYLFYKVPDEGYRSRACLKVIDSVVCHKPPGLDYVPLEDSPLYAQSLHCQEAFRIRTFDEQRLTEAAVFAISMQAAKTEPLFDYFKKIAPASVDELRSFTWHRINRNPARWKNEDRLHFFFDFADQYGGIESLTRDFLKEPDVMRRRLKDEVKWLDAKTASIFYYASGGNSLATIDMHVLEQARGCGLDIKDRYVIPQVRVSGKTKGKAVRDRPRFDEYLRIEQDLKEFWEEYDVFEKLSDGRLDVARWFTTFWLAGIWEDRFQQRQPYPELSYIYSDDKANCETPRQRSLFENPL